MDSDDRRILLIVGGGEQLQKEAIRAALSGKGGSIILIDDIERAAVELGGGVALESLVKEAANMPPRNSGKGKNKRDRANKYGSPFGKKRG